MYEPIPERPWSLQNTSIPIFIAFYSSILFSIMLYFFDMKQLTSNQIILENLEKKGILEPTPVQKQVIPEIKLKKNIPPQFSLHLHLLLTKARRDVFHVFAWGEQNLKSCCRESWSLQKQVMLNLFYFWSTKWNQTKKKNKLLLHHCQVSSCINRDPSRKTALSVGWDKSLCAFVENSPANWHQGHCLKLPPGMARKPHKGSEMPWALPGQVPEWQSCCVSGPME